MNIKKTNIMTLAMASILGGVAFAEKYQIDKTILPRPSMNRKPRGKSRLGPTYSQVTHRDSYGVTYEWNAGRLIRTSERVSKLSRAERRRIWANK